MRSLVATALLLGVAVHAAAAQTSTLHEVRYELFVASPRIYGVGATFIVEQHLGAFDLGPSERIQGMGLVSPLFHGTSVGSEVRQVLTPSGIEHRYVQTINAIIPLWGGFAIRDRTRLEFRDIATKWSKRYQNRFAVGHDVGVLGRTCVPYVQGDLSYDTRYSTINRRETTVGVRVPLSKEVNVDSYVTRQSDTKRSPLLLVTGGAILRVAL